MTGDAHPGVQNLNAEDGPPGGAYGFRIEGVSGARNLLADAPDHWPTLTISSCVDAGSAPEQEVTDARAVLGLRSGGWVVVQRGAGTARFHLTRAPSDAALVHPHLSPAAMVCAYWLGRESFHAGAIVVDGGVWGVLGEKEAGKSTLLATMAQAGVPVHSDDILVLDGTTALAGPRSIDLRGPAAEQLGIGEPLGVLGTRERWRVTLPGIAAELPLRGWISLRWGDPLAVTPVRGAERLRRIGANRGFLLYPPDPAELIALSALPVLELTRPKRWEIQEAANARLLEAIRQADG